MGMPPHFTGSIYHGVKESDQDGKEDWASTLKKLRDGQPLVISFHFYLSSLDFVSFCICLYHAGADDDTYFTYKHL